MFIFLSAERLAIIVPFILAPIYPVQNVFCVASSVRLNFGVRSRD
jgi:hypothetical protein